ncbi:MAG: nitrogenase [Proteobacteria bacterium]|nr:nitrogenase [Pseudomonadota bacterium]
MSDNYTSTTNACKLCKPIGACLAFKGVEGAVPFLHGSQGCATYMRRYIISHFREPMDIASSSLGEKNAIFGGGPNLKQGIKNVTTKYGAKMIGIATTCLTETIGDDVPSIIKNFREEEKSIFESGDSPLLVNVSTPSYGGTHMEGFHDAVKALVDQIATKEGKDESVNLLPGFISPADIRYLKEVFSDFNIKGVILPDISESLDGTALLDYQKISEGGTPLSKIKSMGKARATIEFGRTIFGNTTAGKLLNTRFGVKNYSLGMPVGLRESDEFFSVIEDISGCKTPEKHVLERGRLIDSYVDAHKYIFGCKAVVYGEEDLVVGLTSFLAEIGIQPVLCASGGKSRKMEKEITAVTKGIIDAPLVKEGVDFYDIGEDVATLKPDLLIGHSKGYALAKKYGIPLMRVGFPIHDRIGGQRVLHLGYRGAQALLDNLVNLVIEKKQNDSPVGYSYM